MHKKKITFFVINNHIQKIQYIRVLNYFLITLNYYKILITYGIHKLKRSDIRSHISYHTIGNAIAYKLHL